MNNKDTDEKDIKTIKGIIRILKLQGRYELASLLRYSYGKLNMSNQYGSYHYSLISTYEIYSPPEINPKIIKLSEDDHKLIFNALLQIFPYGEYR